MTATREQIVYRWLEVLAARQVNFDRGIDVDDDTYINGAPIHVDHDYYQGHLLEIVERDSGTVSFVAIAEFHGPKITECDEKLNGDDVCPYCLNTGILALEWDHDSMWYEPYCGTFFDRTPEADLSHVGRWAVTVIYGMIESYSQRRR